MSKTIVKPRQNGTVKSTEDISPIKNGKGHSCSPLKRLKPSDEVEGQQQQLGNNAHPVHVDSDDAELARKLHEQLNGPESPTAAPITRHISRVRKAPVFYKPEFGGYQGYHGVEGGPEQEDGTGEVSPRHAKELQIPRELRRLHEHSVSMSDSEAKSNFPAGPRRTRASSVPDPDSESGQAQRPLAARSADQGAKKRAEVKAEGDADTHSRSGTHQRRKQRSLTPELRLTRSMQPPQGSQPHPVPTDQRKNGRSLPVKLEQPAASGEKPALNQGSSGSPGKGTGSSIQQGGQKRRNSNADGDGMLKAEVTSNRLRQGTGGASTSGESHSHVDLAVACPDQADAVGGSGRRGSNSGAAGVSKRAKLPAKNPMVLQKQNGSYYRVRVLKEETYRVKIEFMGFEQQLQPTWLARDSERIWRGSYKNKAWKHLGDGAWDPRSGERGAPLVAHGTRQNQYTKRRALLNVPGNNTSSNNDSDDNVGSSEDRRQRDGHCADTGFTAEAAALGHAQGKDDLSTAQNPSSSQIRAEGAQPVGESGVLGRLEKSESSGLRAKSRAGRGAVAHASSGDSNKGHKRNSKDSEPEPGDGGSDPQEADTSSGDDAVPMDVACDARSDEKAEGTANLDARAAQDHPAKSSHSMDDQRSPNPSKDVAAQEATARTDRHSQKDKHSHRAKPSAVVETAAARDSALLGDLGQKDEAHTSSADENRDVGSNIPKPAVNQAAKASKAPKGSSAAVRAAAAPDAALKAAASSGSGQGSKGKGQVGPSEQPQKAGKAPSALEVALQCEEDLADDAAASPGDAAAPKATEKAGDDKSKAAAEAEAAPKPVVKPRRDRKGRIRGTYGINAKPVAVETPADSPPAPGVTRASLRPKPTAKASPDDEEVETVKPAAGVRHLRAVSSGPDASGAHDSPGSPMHIKASAPEVRKPNGRTAIQRRAAAANFAVAAAVAAEAADIMPKSIQHSGRVSAKNHTTHRRSGSNSMNRFALDHVRSGRITKALSGGSSGAGSSGGTIRFGSLMDALGELEGREGGFRPQAHSSGALSLGASSGFGGYGGTLRPALFGSGSHGFVSRWHEPLGPVSPRILTLSPDLFQLGSSSQGSAAWSVPSSCHSMVDAGMSLQPQFPLFKAS
ncbi:TPA: hypothetical protein ACH3X2_012722 [Trebouxia sp. C0005]